MSFGPLVTGADVRHAVIDNIQFWIGSYLAQRERETNRPVQSLPVPRSYVTVFDIERWPEEQLPSLLVAVPNTSEEPVKDGSNFYRGFWRVELTIVVQASADPDELVNDYIATLRRVMIEKPGLRGFADGSKWVGERYDVLGSRNMRSLAAGTTAFEIEVREVAKSFAGPGEPTVIEPVAEGIVREAEIIVHPTEVGGADVTVTVPVIEVGTVVPLPTISGETA